MRKTWIALMAAVAILLGGVVMGAAAIALGGAVLAPSDPAAPASTSAPAAKPVAKPAAKPAVKAAKPAAKPVAKPVAKPAAKKPAAKPAAKPRPPRKAPVLWTVTKIVDGDTIDVARGSSVERVRVIGIDTPERGECGFDESTDAMRALVAGERVRLVAGAVDDRDRYDRLLRYVDVVTSEGTIDAGYRMLARGFAIARYDSRDGYGPHDREARHVAKDEATPLASSCAEPAPLAAPAPAPEPEPEPEPEPAAPAAPVSEPGNAPGPDLDCGDIQRMVAITGPDNHALDRDGDGWACESYG